MERNLHASHHLVRAAISGEDEIGGQPLVTRQVFGVFLTMAVPAEALGRTKLGRACVTAVRSITSLDDFGATGQLANSETFQQKMPPTQERALTHQHDISRSASRHSAARLNRDSGV